ncbi:MAG: efflux RND transporter periplasmic adaptor subunit, partial [Rikenellaceae bacterium]|nr:efflux RND transporter periplasmic adaptor subunit [Rikenellaceae bacterium]
MRTLFFLLLVLGALSGVGCHSKKKTAPLPPRQLKVVRVEQQMIPTPMSFTGQLSSNYSAVIQPRVSGYLTSKNYEKGM